MTTRIDCGPFVRTPLPVCKSCAAFFVGEAVACKIEGCLRGLCQGCYQAFGRCSEHV